MGFAIVALPEQDDRVYDISSEKVPHLTLLHLGDQVSADAAAKIIEFVEHAAADLNPFWGTVDYRGTLGADNADVLFLEDSSWDLKGVKEFRSSLLKNNTIQAAYSSSDQFDGWTPHVTLGFPDTPANEPENDKKIHSIRFDRIAVWAGDYSGPEFRLKYEDYGMDATMAMGEAAVKQLFHHGVKGMKWGVRNDKGHEGEKAKTKKIAKLDKKFERNSKTLGTTLEVMNGAARKMNSTDIPRINNKPEYKGQDFRRDTPLRRQYYKEMQDAYITRLDQAAKAKGTNASGTKRYTVLEHDDGSWEVAMMDTKTGKKGDPSYMTDSEATKFVEEGMAQEALNHADGAKVPGSWIMQPNYDEDGFITALNDNLGTDAIAHYGVKGMRWGVTTVDKATSPTLQREKETRLAKSKDVTVTQRRAGTYVKTKGGTRQKASDDAVKAHAGRQKAKKSTTDALTNDELKAVVERLRLEQEYAKLDSKVKRRGQSFIARLFQTPEGRQISADMAKRMAKASG